MDYLSDNEKKQIETFIQNETMREAVKKVLLAGLYDNGVMKPGKPAQATRNHAFGLVSQSPDIENEILGQDLRAVWQGLCLVENGFNKLSEFSVKVEPKSTKNNAR